MKTKLTLLLVLSAFNAVAQDWVYSEEFKTDFWGNQDKGLEIIDCNHDAATNARIFSVCSRKEGYDRVALRQYVTHVNTDAVARGVATQRPKRQTVVINSAATARKYGKNYNHQTSAAGQAWRAQRAEQIAEERRRIAEQRRQEAIAKKIADDNRAAMVEAATNARLQGETDRKIERDRYHATQGAQIAQQNARRTATEHLRGPQFTQRNSELTAEEKAGILRRQNKPRRVMANNATARNTARRQLTPTVRKGTMDPTQQAMLRRALAVKAELQRRKAAAQASNGYELQTKGGTRFTLSKNAVSTLGNDWKSPDVSNLGPDNKPKYAPAPLTRTNRPKSTLKITRPLDEKAKRIMYVAEIIDGRPFTDAENAYLSQFIVPNK